MYQYYNANPAKRITGDCSIRAISKAAGLSWDQVYDDLVVLARSMYDMPSNNSVTAELLKDYGFQHFPLCPQCRTVRGFCLENPYGIFVLGTGTHMVAVIDGTYFDTFDSGDEIPVYAFKKEVYR